MSTKKQIPKQVSRSLPSKTKLETKGKPTEKKTLRNKDEEKKDKRESLSDISLVKKKIADEKIKRVNSTTKPSNATTKRTNPVKRNPSSSRPVTPPSTRVTKSEFFPTKKMYSNALKTIPKSRKEEASSDSSVSERPRTATLKSGKIITKENPAAGPEVSSSSSQPDAEYEDDFENYESDFEEYSSSSSTRDINTESSSSDSSLEEIKSPTVRVQSSEEERKLDSGNYELPEAKHKQILHKITETACVEEKSSDEGFEDGKSSLQFINFASANKKAERRRSIERMKKRGEEILSMIKLDLCNFTLYDFPQMLYEDFIKIFGRNDTIQTATQTGEDNRNEETQTENIDLCDKWAQFPSKVLTKYEDNEDFWVEYKESIAGVSGNAINSPQIQNNVRLEKFLEATGNLILNLKKEELSSKINNFSNKQTNMPFSKGVVVYDTSKVDFLRNKNLIDAIFTQDKSILTVHTSTASISDESFVCLWQIGRIEEPLNTFHCFGTISSVMTIDSFLFAGTTDGNIAGWDFLQKNPEFYSEIATGHSNKVIAIEMVTNPSNITQICTLDEEGFVIIWSLLKKEHSTELIVNTKISLRKLYPEIDDFQCHAMILNNFNELFVATNYGIILHCLANGAKTTIKKYQDGVKSTVLSLQRCPFSNFHFIAGFQNGDIKFFTQSMQKPLIIMSNKSDLKQSQPIEELQWSQQPLVFYSRNKNVIDIWNLRDSDMFPSFSVPFKENIVTMKVSHGDEDINNYLIVADQKGQVSLYTLECGDSDDLEKDKNYFLNYINRYV